MADHRTQLIETLEDTEAFIRENPTLAAKAAQARKETVFYPADEYPEIKAIARG